MNFHPLCNSFQYISERHLLLYLFFCDHFLFCMSTRASPNLRKYSDRYSNFWYVFCLKMLKDWTQLTSYLIIDLKHENTGPFTDFWRILNHQMSDSFQENIILFGHVDCWIEVVETLKNWNKISNNILFFRLCNANRVDF